MCAIQPSVGPPGEAVRHRVRIFEAEAGEMHFGRPIGNIRSSMDIPELEKRLAEVIETLHTYETEVQDVSGRWYSLRIRPYRTEEHKIEGAVLILVDIDPLKRTLDEIREARDFNQSVIETVRSPLLVLDATLRVKLANPAFYQVFQLATAEAEQNLVYEMGGGQWNIPRLKTLLEEQLRETGRLHHNRRASAFGFQFVAAFAIASLLAMLALITLIAKTLLERHLDEGHESRDH